MKDAAVEFSNSREDLAIEPNFRNCGRFRHTGYRYAHRIVSPKRPGHIKEGTCAPARSVDSLFERVRQDEYQANAARLEVRYVLRKVLRFLAVLSKKGLRDFAVDVRQAEMAPLVLVS
jgi:hypothetical protein